MMNSILYLTIGCIYFIKAYPDALRGTELMLAVCYFALAVTSWQHCRQPLGGDKPDVQVREPGPESDRRR